MAALLAAGALACGAPGASAQGGGADAPGEGAANGAPPDASGASVTVAILPRGTEPEDLGAVEGISPGLLSAGLSGVSATQTFLDISAGNRLFTSLYPGDDPLVIRAEKRVRDWDEIVARAEGAPAEIVPGLLASALAENGVRSSADALLVTPALIAADTEGRIERTGVFECVRRRCPGLSVVPLALDELPAAVERLRGDDLLIALERPPPPKRDTLAIGIAGPGFDGNLTSATTRADGFVIATDIAPTILHRYGIAVPSEMNGRAITSEGDPDAASVADRGGRMRVVAGRRSPVIVDNLMIWAGLALLVALATRGRRGPLAFGLLGLSVVYTPLLLLAGAALTPAEDPERLVVGLGAPLAAAMTLWALRGWAALAVACAITVGAYALDVVAGSPLTAQSLLGPNPGLGVRFFGIGNELESVLSVLIPVGVGAALVAVRERSGAEPSRRAAVIAFVAAGVGFAAIFAAGRFGADVGAAIVFPAGAAMAALAVPGAIAGRRALLALFAAPLAALGLLAAIDLTLGGDSHLSRSVFEAGGAEQLGDVAERRLRLSAGSIDRASGQPLFWFALASIAMAAWQRRRLARWLRPVPLARAGMAGAAGAVILGVVANDSGATFLTIGTIAMLGVVAFAYARHAERGAPARAGDHV